MTRNGRDALVRVAAPFAVAVIVLAAWQVLVTVNDVPAYLVPSPLVVAQTLFVDRALLVQSLGVTLEGARARIHSTRALHCQRYDLV